MFPRLGCGLLMSLLRKLMSPRGILQRLFRVLVPGQVIFFPVMHHRCAMSVCGLLVELGGSLM